MTEEWKKAKIINMLTCPVCGDRTRELLLVSGMAKLKVCPACLEDFRCAVLQNFNLSSIKFFGHKPQRELCPFCHQELHEPFSLQPLFQKTVCNDCANKVNDLINSRIAVRRVLWGEWEDESE